MPLEIVRAESVRKAAAALAPSRAPASSAAARSSCATTRPATSRFGALVLSDGLGLDQIRVSGGRAEIGAAVTMAKLAAHPDLAFLRARRERDRRAGGARDGDGRRQSFRAVAIWRSFGRAAGARRRGRDRGQRAASETLALEKFLRRAGEARGAIVTKVAFALPPPNAFRFAKVDAAASARRFGAVDRRAAAARRRPREGRARRLWRDGADRDPRDGGGEGARRARRSTMRRSRRRSPSPAEGTSPASDPFASDWYRRNVLPVHLARLLKR